MAQTNKLKNTIDYLARKMPSVDPRSSDPVETLSIDDIVYLQVYLENIKTIKMENMSKLKKINNSTTFRKIQEDNYYNPYECGARQNILHPTVLTPHQGPYANDPTTLQQMGVQSTKGTIPSHIRNIDIESYFLQKEMTHLPGNREITERTYDRFDLLPFDPQDTRHIIWSDNMPRGGYPTRNDRLELQ